MGTFPLPALRTRRADFRHRALQWNHAARTRVPGHGQRAGLASRGTKARTLALDGRCVVRPVDALATATARVVPFACACDDVRHSLLRRTLDREHVGRDREKDQVLDFLVARHAAAERPGGRPHAGAATILCLLGPAGIGRTTFAGALAVALGRRFVRVSLAGAENPAAILGVARPAPDAPRRRRPPPPPTTGSRTAPASARCACRSPRPAP